MANCYLTDASSAKSAITILVSSRTLPVIQTDLLATLFNGLLHGSEVISVNGPGKAQQSLAWHSTNSGCYERTSKFQHPTLLFNRQLTELFANFGLHSLRYHNLFIIVCYFYCCLIIADGRTTGWTERSPTKTNMGNCSRTGGNCPAAWIIGVHCIHPNLRTDCRVGRDASRSARLSRKGIRQPLGFYGDRRERRKIAVHPSH
jgi:hypothetical protein